MPPSLRERLRQPSSTEKSFPNALTEYMRNLATAIGSQRDMVAVLQRQGRHTVSVGSVSRILRGQRPIPLMDAPALFRALGMDPAHQDDFLHAVVLSNAVREAQMAESRDRSVARMLRKTLEPGLAKLVAQWERLDKLVRPRRGGRPRSRT